MAPSQGMGQAFLDTEAGFSASDAQLVAWAAVPPDAPTLRFTAAALASSGGFSAGQAIVELGYEFGGRTFTDRVFDAASQIGSGTPCGYGFDGTCAEHEEVSVDIGPHAGKQIHVAVIVGYGNCAPPRPAALLADDFRID